MKPLPKPTAEEFLMLLVWGPDETWAKLKTCDCAQIRGWVKTIKNTRRRSWIPPATAEHGFIDRDIFVEYVRSEVNPAREKEGLSLCTPALAIHLYNVLTSGRYRK